LSASLSADFSIPESAAIPSPINFRSSPCASHQVGIYAAVVLSLQTSDGFFSSVPQPTFYTKEFSMSISCPQCDSDRIRSKNIGRNAGSTIGTFAGAARGASLGAAAGPAGVIVGGIAGALMGGLFGGAAGGAVGSRIGKAVDDNILDNYQCKDCGYTFSK
jgi:hypothetical protein